MLRRRDLAERNLEMVGIWRGVSAPPLVIPHDLQARLSHTVENVHQIAVEGVLIRQDGEASHDGAELFAACFLRESEHQGLAPVHSMCLVVEIRKRDVEMG